MMLLLADFNRLCLVAVGIVLALGTLVMVVLALRGKRVVVVGQWARLFAVLAFDAYVVFTEIGRLGHVVTWRLPVGNVAMVLATVGLAQQVGSLLGPGEKTPKESSLRRLRIWLSAVTVVSLAIAITFTVFYVRYETEQNNKNFCTLTGRLANLPRPMTATGLQLIRDGEDLHRHLGCPR